MKKIVLIIAAALFAAACSGAGTGGTTGAGSAKMDVKIGGRDSTLEVKSSGAYKSIKTFTDKEGKMTKALSFYAVMGNFEMDTTGPGWMKKPLTAPGQMRISLQLIGEEGTDDKAELKPGTYKADPTGKYMKIDSLIVSTFTDGKQADTSFETTFSGSKITGEVNVRSATAEEISGDINVTEGDKTVKGTFSAKMPVKK